MKTAEEILKKYIKIDDLNQIKTMSILPIVIIDAMVEYAEQFKSDKKN